MKLRDYQQKTIDLLYGWWDKNKGNPCVVLPTGAGKSVVLAAFIKKAIEDFNTKMIVLTHQKELIEQDYQKTISMIPDIDCGVYCAGMNKKELNHKVTFASIQSIIRRKEELDSVDLILIDECHLINNKSEGMYRTFISYMTEKNKYLKCIGMTATPYRLGQGMITDGDLFNPPLIEPITIKELQDMGYLSKLSSKLMKHKIDTTGIHIVGGDYNRKELEERVLIEGYNEEIVDEICRWCKDRKNWLIFCTGVNHARKIADLLNERHILTVCITGNTPKKEREQYLEDFKKGFIQAVTNVNVLTTGFDNPNIDLIVMLRPTCSPGLYMQMVGRGLRIAEGKENCLILDFAGNIERNGPINNVMPPSKRGQGRGIPPMKTCPECLELVPIQTEICPSCGFEWNRKEECNETGDDKTGKYSLSEADINGFDINIGERIVPIKDWTWSKGVSKAGNPMWIITYYPDNFCIKPIKEFVAFGTDWLNERNSRRIEQCKGKGKPTKILVDFSGRYPEIKKIVFNDGFYDFRQRSYINN